MRAYLHLEVKDVMHPREVDARELRDADARVVARPRSIRRRATFEDNPIRPESG